MGIQGLLPLLKSIMTPIHVKDLGGCCVAVDTYSWLHKGALSCSKQLCKGEPTTRHIEYCMHRVNLLRHHGVKPILVFDGGHLPMKNEEETKRARSRKENLERAIEHESMGNSAAAYECYQKAVDISPSVAYELIQVLKKENVDYVVAPYEADAQMTFLALSKRVDAIITEDSDLIPFGCPRIIFKMDKFGQGVQFQYSMLHQNKDLSFTGFTKRMLLEMCILSGCDYLPSLPGMGLKKAHALIQKLKSYDKVIKHLKYNGVSVPPLYEESFKKALWAFQHQRVYDLTIEDIVHLTDVPSDFALDSDFLGPYPGYFFCLSIYVRFQQFLVDMIIVLKFLTYGTWIPQDLVKGIARGDIDPITKLPFQGEIANAGIVVDRTYLLKFETERKQVDLPVQKNVLTNYFCSASLQAKRKFRAPRVTPKYLDSKDGPSPSLERHDSTKSIKDSETNTDKLSIISKEDSFTAKVPFRSSEHCVPLELSRYTICKPCPTLRKENNCKLTVDVVESKTRSVSQRAIVRSSYFKHKPETDNQVKDQNEKINCEKDVSHCDTTSIERALLETKELKSAMKKRESIPMELTENEIVKVKHARTDVSVPNERDHIASTTQTSIDEGKFGCNISHLSHYSDVAEKSMEKFVSIISAFRCTPSGSRASGLRPPLKDINNKRTRSPVEPIDLEKFSYIPSNKHNASASQNI